MQQISGEEQVRDKYESSTLPSIQQAHSKYLMVK